MAKKIPREYFYDCCMSCLELATINRNIFDCGKLQCPTQKHVCGMMLTDEEVKAYKRSRGIYD